MKNNKLTKSLSPNVRKQILHAQQTEVTEYHIYKRLARESKNTNHKAILNSIAEDELRHYKIWMQYIGHEVEPNRWSMFKFYWITKLFGLSTGLKQMEMGERRAQINYNEIAREIPEAKQIAMEENEHEKKIFDLLKNKILK